MSTWSADKLVVIAVWVIGFIGPLVSADAQTLTVWSVFALGVAGILSLLERLDRATVGHSDDGVA